MAKDETRGTREEGRGGRRAASETAESTPLVSAKRGKFRAVEKAQIEALVFARLEDYKAFVAEVEGEEPEDGAIISAGLEMLFDADKSFERWGAEQRRKNRNSSGANGSGANGTRESATAAVAGVGLERSRRTEARSDE